jgi:hypothetical protein
MNATTSNFFAKVSNASSTLTTVEKSNSNEGRNLYTCIRLRSSGNTPYGEPSGNSIVFIPISGALSEGRELARPIMVKIEEEDREEGEDREFLVSETKYHIHGVGATIQEAIGDFKSIFSEYFDTLSEEEGNLSPYMHGQLEYLRSMIRFLY